METRPLRLEEAASASNFENRDPLKGDGNPCTALSIGSPRPPALKTETRLKGMETVDPCEPCRFRHTDNFENRDPLKGDGNGPTRQT